MVPRRPIRRVFLETWREHRFAAVAWLVGGALTNFVMVFSLDAELRDFPGGPEALPQVLGPSIEAFRPLRWPAERLDTLGGYVSYHNVTLIALFLGVYALVQGSRLTRTLEANGLMEVLLGTGLSRGRLLVMRVLSFAALLAAISAGIAGGTAAALALVGEPNTPGAFLAFLAIWCGALLCVGVGLLLSQFIVGARLCAGVGTSALIAVYILGNAAGTFGAWSFLELLSPFTYTNLSRTLVPGVAPHWSSMAGLVGAALVLVGLAAALYARRDVGSAIRLPGRPTLRVRLSHPLLASSLRGDAAIRNWVAIVTWSLSGAALGAIMMSLQPQAMRAWDYFDVLLPPTDAVLADRDAQYLGLSLSLLVPVVTSFVVLQAARWAEDSRSGRLGLVFTAPVSWRGVLLTRVGVALAGTVAIVVATCSAVWLVGAGLGIDLEWAGVLRLLTTTVVLCLAMVTLAFGALLVFPRRGETLVLALYLGVAYVLTYVVPMLNWPEWVGKLSVFTAYGTPYVDWPEPADAVLLFALAGPGLVLVALITARGPKTH